MSSLKYDCIIFILCFDFIIRSLHKTRVDGQYQRILPIHLKLDEGNWGV